MLWRLRRCCEPARCSCNALLHHQRHNWCPTSKRVLLVGNFWTYSFTITGTVLVGKSWQILSYSSPLHTVQCSPPSRQSRLRWEILGDFKTKLETNSDYSGTLSMWCWCFFWEPKLVEFSSKLLSEQLKLSYIHISFIFKLRRYFFPQRILFWTTFLWKATYPSSVDKSFEQLFHIFWGDSHNTLQCVLNTYYEISKNQK